MPWVSCPVAACGTSCRINETNSFKLLEAMNDECRKWKEEWLTKITKTRVIDQREEILNDSANTCENRFKAEAVSTGQCVRESCED